MKPKSSGNQKSPGPFKTQNNVTIPRLIEQIDDRIAELRFDIEKRKGMGLGVAFMQKTLEQNISLKKSLLKK
jgi:hypothetical protein